MAKNPNWDLHDFKFLVCQVILYMRIVDFRGLMTGFTGYLSSPFSYRIRRVASVTHHPSLRVPSITDRKNLNYDFYDYMMDYDFTLPPFPPVRCT